MIIRQWYWLTQQMIEITRNKLIYSADSFPCNHTMTLLYMLFLEHSTYALSYSPTQLSFIDLLCFRLRGPNTFSGSMQP